MVDFGKSGKMIKICGNVDKSNTDNGFNILFLVGNRISCRQKMSILFNQICINKEMLSIYIYIYISNAIYGFYGQYILCVYIYIYIYMA